MLPAKAGLQTGARSSVGHLIHILQRLRGRAGPPDDGAFFALCRTVDCAGRLQTRIAPDYDYDYEPDPGPPRAGALPALLHDPLALAQRLAGSRPRPNPDARLSTGEPTAVLGEEASLDRLPQGMGGMLNGDVALVPSGSAEARLLPAMRQVANAIDDASIGSGLFETPPDRHLNERLADQVHALCTAVAGATAVRAEINEAVLSLDAAAAAAALITAIDTRLSRSGRMLQS